MQTTNVKNTPTALNNEEQLNNGKRNWVKPDVIVIGIESGLLSSGVEGQKTSDFAYFGLYYHS